MAEYSSARFEDRKNEGATHHLLNRLMETPFLGALLGHRFIKFGTVGFSGLFINLMVLYLGQEVLFSRISSQSARLNLSLSSAIFLSTVNNYIWNRLWTWEDRHKIIRKNFFVQMGQYFIACWLAISLQFVFTTILSHVFHYLVANIISILVAAVANYLINDIWTFSVKRKGRS